MPALGAHVIGDLAATDLAEPGEERGLAAVVAQLAHRLDQRGLHHVLGGVLVAVEARQRESIDAREIRGEELAERELVACEHPLHPIPIVRHASLRENCPRLDAFQGANQSAAVRGSRRVP